MSTVIQIRNVPEDLRRKLKARAAEKGVTLSEYLLAEVRRLAERPSMEEFRARLAARKPLGFDIGSADAVREEREGR